MSLLVDVSIDEGRLAAHLDWFAGVRRDTGGPGEDAAADYIVKALREAGVEVRVHEFDAFLSYPREASLTEADGASLDLEVVTHSFAASTPAEGLTGELVYLPDADFRRAAGKLVLVDGLCTPITVLEASRAGVAGMVFVNQGDVVHNMIATTIWGTPSLDQLDRLPGVAAVSISRPDGELLKARLAEGPLEVRLTTRVETGWYRSKLPEAIIPGSDGSTDAFVLVGAHYCSWEIGITDNATGDACLIEMARALQAQRHALKRSVRLCWWPGHSHGRYSGSTWYADNFFHDLADNCVAYHNVDSPGVRGATLYVARHTTAEVEAFCVGLIGEMTGQTTPEVHRPSRAADQSFLANGVPAFSTYPFLPHEDPERKPWTGGCGNAWWWHSSADVRDKADEAILALDTRISIEGVSRLANAHVLPLDPSRSAQEAVDFVTDFAAATAGHLDVTALSKAADELLVAATDLSELARAAQDDPSSNPVAINQGLMRFSRALMPAVYTKGGRHVHDPAEWSPLMRNDRSSLFPSLGAGFSLNDLAGQQEYGFVKAGLVRQMNRVIDGFREAKGVCQAASAAAHTRRSVETQE
jgi:hypothetical protein